MESLVAQDQVQRDKNAADQQLSDLLFTYNTSEDPIVRAILAENIAEAKLNNILLTNSSEAQRRHNLYAGPQNSPVCLSRRASTHCLLPRPKTRC